MDVTVGVVRTVVARWRFAQGLMPAAIIGAIVARHFGQPAATMAALLITGAAFAAFLSARRSFGRCQLRGGSRRIQICKDSLEVLASDVITWTFDRNTAHIYGPSVSWKLVASGNDGTVLQTILAGAFGKARLLKRRGSLRGRRFAFVVSVVGAGSLGAGIAFEIVPLAFLGVPSLVVGLATRGGLSQKIAR